MKSSLAIEAVGISKKYRLGTIGMGSLREDLSRWWNKDKKNSQLENNNFNSSGIDKSIIVSDKEFWALHDLNFSIPKGEVVGFIGANGSGKSTLLKILSRITEPTRGEVKVRGKVASLLEVGTGFHPELTGRENIYVNGAILGMTRKEVKQKFDEIVDFAGIKRFIDTPIKRYSSGMTVRLGFAVAAHLEPDILIIDEVLAVGDAAFQQKCIGKMEDISKDGKTVLFVSHQMPMVENLCNRAYLLNKGEVETFGKTKDVVNFYLNKYNINANTKNKNNWESRIGNGEVTLSKITINSTSLGSTNSIKLGDSAYFIFHFVSNNITICSNQFSFRFAINNEHGVRVTTVDSRSVNFTFNPEKKFSLKIKLKKINFAEGFYYITTFIGTDEIAYDWITNAHIFNIIPGDFYGTGQTQEIPPGEILLEHEMEFIND